MKYRKVEIKDIWAVVWRLVIFITIEVIAATNLLERGLFIWWWLIILGLLVWIVRWHCHYFAYKCIKCGHHQRITFLKTFLSINMFSRKYLKCEKCQKWNMSKLLVIN